MTRKAQNQCRHYGRSPRKLARNGHAPRILPHLCSGCSRFRHHGVTYPTQSRRKLRNTTDTAAAFPARYIHSVPAGDSLSPLGEGGGASVAALMAPPPCPRRSRAISIQNSAGRLGAPTPLSGEPVGRRRRQSSNPLYPLKGSVAAVTILNSAGLGGSFPAERGRRPVTAALTLSARPDLAVTARGVAFVSAGRAPRAFLSCHSAKSRCLRPASARSRAPRGCVFRIPLAPSLPIAVPSVSVSTPRTLRPHAKGYYGKGIHTVTHNSDRRQSVTRRENGGVSLSSISVHRYSSPLA